MPTNTLCWYYMQKWINNLQKIRFIQPSFSAWVNLHNQYVLLWFSRLYNGCISLSHTIHKTSSTEKRECILKHTLTAARAQRTERDGFHHPTYKEVNHKENSTNSLTTVAGDPIPNTGTMSTRSQDSTIPPSNAPVTSPRKIIRDAFPEDMTAQETIKTPFLH